MKRMLTSCFGLGMMPIAAGTWGSIPPVVLFFVLRQFNISPTINASIFAVLAIAFSYFTIAFSDDVIKKTGKKDPSEVVSDEVAGQSVTLIFTSFLVTQNLYALCITAFLLFRFFDITKLYPANKLEQLPSGKGILLDDIMAGIYAGILMLIVFVIDWSQTLTSDAAIISTPAAIILGMVQGLTEFLPVSSSGHLVLFEHFLPDVNPDSQEMLLFDLSIHVATVLAILVYYCKDIIKFLKNIFQFKKYGNTPIAIYKKSPSVRLLVLAIITTGVTGVGYILFKDQLESARKIEIVSLMWIVTATLLLITDMRTKARIGLRQFGVFAAIIIGIAQTAAILPGISRSGSTICIAILLGLHRNWAIQYSFLIAIPAILAGAALKLIEQIDTISQATLPIHTVLLAMTAAFVMGIISLFLLVKSSRKRKLKWFAVYCYLLAIGSLIYSYFFASH